MVLPVAVPAFQVYEVAPLAVSVLVSFLQISLRVGTTDGVGKGFKVILAV